MSQEPSQPTAVVFGRSHRSFSFSHGHPFKLLCWFFDMLVALRPAQASTLRGSHCLNISIRVCYPFRLISQAICDRSLRMTRMSVATMLPSTHACELSSTLGFTSLPVNYVEWYCTFLCDNLSRLWYINIHLSSVVHHRSAFPRTMID
jgi:hypothetical protein